MSTATRRGPLLRALCLALEWGDTRALVIIDREDSELTGIADALGARHPVDIYRWPNLPS